MNYTVYMHTTPSGKRYIGITKNKPQRRWGSNGCGYTGNQHFYNAIKKYGWDNIEHKILSNWHTQEEAEELEKYLIARFKTHDNRFGYNKTLGGERNKQPTEETRKKMSKAQRGRKLSKEARKNMSKAQKGRKHTEETRKKISESNKGKVFSEEHRKKISKWQKGLKKQYCSRPISDEQKKKLRECRIGTTLSKETKDKISQTLLKKENMSYWNKKPIIQYSLNGNELKVYSSIIDAVTENKWKGKGSNISRTCNGKQRTAYGYIWKYADERTRATNDNIISSVEIIERSENG